MIICARINLLNNKKSLKDSGRRKPSSKLTLETKWYHSCGYSDDSQSCEQLKKRKRISLWNAYVTWQEHTVKLKKHVTDKSFEKKLDFEPEFSSITGNVCYHYNSWVTGVCMACIFHRHSGEKASQIEWLFESNLKSFGYFKCSTALWLPLNPSCKGNLLARVWWALQP